MVLCYFLPEELFCTVFVCSFPYLRNCKLKSDIVFAVNVILSLSNQTCVICGVERLIKFQSSTRPESNVELHMSRI